jgi:quercetin dioxygenase-like cupin family protein
MDNKEAIKKQLIGAGYIKIFDYNDPPNEFFSEHDHEFDERVFVISGSMSISMAGRDYALKAGDQLDFPAKLKHSAKIGPEGCIYIAGEK